jgi:hypothetical protein
MLPAFIKEWPVSPSARKVRPIHKPGHTPSGGTPAVWGDVPGERRAGSFLARPSRRRRHAPGPPTAAGRPGARRRPEVQDRWWCRS